MVLIDLPSLGATTYQKLLKIREKLPLHVVPRATFEDKFRLQFLSTNILFGTVLLPLAATSFSRASMEDVTFLFHPVHGLWIVYFSDSVAAIPDVGPAQFDGFLQAWQAVEEELLWDEIPMRPMLVFKNMREEHCFCDFSKAPFPVFFKDTAGEAPERICGDLSQSVVKDMEGSVDLNAISALGALSIVGEIRLEEIRKIGCEQENYDKIQMVMGGVL